MLAGRISLLRLLLEIVGVAGALVPCHRSLLAGSDPCWYLEDVSVAEEPPRSPSLCTVCSLYCL